MRRIRAFAILGLAALILGACNLPSAPDEGELVQTSAALTVEYGLTLGASQPSETSTQPATEPATATGAPPTNTPTDVPTDVCDAVSFVSDVTVPDGTEFEPGESFTKTWRLKNVGTCTWSSGYSLVFDGGDSMGAPASKQLTSGTVPPGSSVDVSVDLTAPGSTGTYRGDFKLRNGSGVVFGLPGPFYVEIDVVEAAAASVVFNLYNKAPSAEWISCGSPCGGGTVLTFGGPDTDSDGFAMYKGGEELEDGSTPSHILETHPMWVDNGVISGLFSNYTVKDGDRFQTQLGFLAKNDGSCGVGEVTYQFNYKEAGTLHNIETWNKTCNGSLIDVDLDISSLKGKTVQFALVVLAKGTSAQDWAVWVDPVIVR